MLQKYNEKLLDHFFYLFWFLGEQKVVAELLSSFIILVLPNAYINYLLANGLQSQKKAVLVRKIGLLPPVGARLVALLFIADLDHGKGPLFSLISTGGLKHSVLGKI
ncbi:hypothetical protein MYP_3601 [Sporocytophaga myxococcoides]|uniref:Uncharacterized protein n=1 Tax=Sporocytophaga myxococcoides TaxID=153721 RepID=A0A098LJ15_9BACT|nr:hypothetical protein [Sporocytophaga myxococcoides]GAL86372.1 hypothetical protein MYP_3601 [Sporocytophaga myxococcoides]